MNKCKILGLLLAAFIGLMGFNELTFAAASKPVVGFVPPAWSQKLEAANRFELVLDAAAVLDKETGLVWEKSPDSIVRNWVDAVRAAYNKNVGGRRGWRLPTIEELASLVDTSVPDNPKLPIGHPFIGVQAGSGDYWSATFSPYYAGAAWVVSFGSGSVDDSNGYVAYTYYIWCVRGGHGYDAR